MSDELKTIKFQLMLSPSEAAAIDDWGFENRIRTRAEAMRRLCQLGLALAAQKELLFETGMRTFISLSEFAVEAGISRERMRETDFPATELENKFVEMLNNTSRFYDATKGLIDSVGFAKKSPSVEEMLGEMRESAQIYDLLLDRSRKAE